MYILREFSTFIKQAKVALAISRPTSASSHIVLHVFATQYNRAACKSEPHQLPTYVYILEK